jgi:hypothetical protein
MSVLVEEQGLREGGITKYPRILKIFLSLER